MSIVRSIKRLPAAALFCILVAFAIDAFGQAVEVHIKIDEARPGIAQIEGRFAKSTGVPNLSFLTTYAGVGKLADRISAIRLADAEKHEVEFRQLQPGEILAERNFAFFAYNVDLNASTNVAAAAHVSWLDREHGILALDDLLPQPTENLSVRLKLELPRNWRIITNEDRVYEDIVDVHDAQRAVVLVGTSWRLMAATAKGVQLAISGEMQVKDEDAAADAGEIYRSYLSTLGQPQPAQTPLIVITKFPIRVPTGTWEAETRGSIVTIASSGGISPADSRLRLQQQLRHELFHLWLPNGVDLSGDYDWFYEGFAVYEEQKLGVAMNQIRFEDFLSTLARAHDIDRFSAPRRSLIDASRERWTGSNALVYARGMLVAFLADVALLDASKGKTSVEEVLRSIFDKHRPPAERMNANEAVLDEMRGHPELKPVVDAYVTGSSGLPWEQYLEKAGLRADIRDQVTGISVKDKLSGRQKALLDKLGYNNWRKLASK